jgi:hypothetical protein
MKDAQVQRLLVPVVKALRAGNGAEAARRFVAALAHDIAVPHSELLHWLETAIGKEPCRQLVRAFAAHPCMGCKRGLEPCRECMGKGVFGDNRICDMCIGFGATNCGFCAGSGWMTYNFAPAGIRIAVLIARTQVGRKQLAGLVVQINRYLGALNNSVGMVAHPPIDELRGDPRLAKVRKACARAAERLEARLRKVLAALAKLSEREAAGASTVARADLAGRRAQFYDRLASSADFAGTSLYHVYLRNLRERTAPGRQNPRKGLKSPHEPRSA